MTAQKIPNNTYDVVILFGSGFKNNIVSLNVEQTQIFKSQLLSTNEVTGSVKNLSVIGFHDKISLLNEKNESVFKTRIPINIKGSLNLDVEIDNHLIHLVLNLKKGYIVMLNNHPSDGTIRVFQSKKNIALY
jgi:hypothetical protein